MAARAIQFMMCALLFSLLVIPQYVILQGIGRPELKPHDLRHALATRLLERGVNIRIVQELLGHSSLNTTQVYIAVSGSHLVNAIKTLDRDQQVVVPEDQLKKLMKMVQQLADRVKGPLSDTANGISPVVYS